MKLKDIFNYFSISAGQQLTIRDDLLSHKYLSQALTEDMKRFIGKSVTVKYIDIDSNFLFSIEELDENWTWTFDMTKEYVELEKQLELLLKNKSESDLTKWIEKKGLTEKQILEALIWYFGK